MSDRLEQALSYHLARKLGGEDLSPLAIREMFDDVDAADLSGQTTEYPGRIVHTNVEGDRKGGSWNSHVPDGSPFAGGGRICARRSNGGSRRPPDYVSATTPVPGTTVADFRESSLKEMLKNLEAGRRPRC